MITQELLNPKSIVVVGGSNNLNSPGGKVLKNLKESAFKGPIYVVNPKEDEIQGIKCCRDVRDLPEVDLAIMAIAAKFTPEAVEVLATQKKTKAFILVSNGFSEIGTEEGHKLEEQVLKIVEDNHACMIGPNGIGVMTASYNGAFTEPTPELDPKGCDFASGSGATAVFILESAVPNGLRFASIYSVGNSPQIGVEEIVKYWDESFDPQTSSKVKLLYMESIKKPQMLLKHASSLIKKGCRIAAIKAGASDAGSRAASSHTGALASSDVAVDALFHKAGIIRCYGREDLISTACVLTYKPLTGKNIAVITHAGGPGVMLTDALSNNGLSVPKIDGPKADELLTKLFHGSAVGNPIDFIATGTAEHLGIIIDYVENHFDHIDGMAVIFGTPGLVKVFDAYDVIAEKLKTCKKPIYPIMPSIKTAKAEIDEFVKKGLAFFPDEVLLGKALAKTFYAAQPAAEANLPEVDVKAIRAVIDSSENGYLAPEKIQILLDAAKIPRAGEKVVTSAAEAVKAATELGFPVVMKVIGPVHKSDVGGVVLNVKTAEVVEKEFTRIMQIKDATAVLIQPMLSGFELFTGAKYEEKFGHMILCGLGGIYIEVFKDTAAALSPLGKEEALKMIRSLKSYKIIKGVRGQAGCDENQFADVLVRLSALLNAAPEIMEMDLNPLLGSPERVVAVDARIRIEK